MAVYDILPSTNLKAEDIRDTLKAGGGNVGDNMLDYFTDAANINQWSFHKPVSYNKDFDMTDQDFYACDDGFTITNYNYPSRIIRALASGEGWVYNIPTGGKTSPYRLGDFRKYEYRAVPWFTLEVEGLNYGAAGDTIRFIMPNDLGWLIGNFNSFKDLASQIQGGAVDVGFIVSSRWTSDASLQGTYYYKIADYLDFQDEPQKKLNIIIPDSSSSISDGTYYVIPVVTTFTQPTAGTFFYISENSGGSGGTWFTIPSNPVTITIDRDRPQFQPLDYIYFEYSNIDFQYGEGNPDPWKRVSFTVKCGFSDTYPGSSGRLVVSFIVENVYPGSGTQVYDKTIGSLGSGTSNIGKGQSITRDVSSGTMYFLATKEETLPVKIDISFTIGGRVYKQTRYVSFP